MLAETLSLGRYFGTDCIRGRANSQITADMALKVGQAAGLAFHRGDHRHRVVIGKDTRLSCYMIEYALVAALLPSEATFSYYACSDAGGGNAAAPARQVYRGSLLDGRLARKENPLYALQQPVWRKENEARQPPVRRFGKGFSPQKARFAAKDRRFPSAIVEISLDL